MVTALRRLFGTSMSSPYTSVKDEIRGFEKLRRGWNSYDAPEISPTAIKWALEVVDVAARRGVPAPSASPTSDGGVALDWLVGDQEVQLLIDDGSLDFNVARRGKAELVAHESLSDVHAVEQSLIDKYLAA